MKIGISYLNTSACIEIISYLIKTVKFYSVHNDGSSAAKIMDEKELFIMKLTPDATVKFRIMSLEERENTNANCLKATLDKSSSTLEVAVPREQLVCVQRVHHQCCNVQFS